MHPNTHTNTQTHTHKHHKKQTQTQTQTHTSTNHRTQLRHKYTHTHNCPNPSHRRPHTQRTNERTNERTNPVTQDDTHTRNDETTRTNVTRPHTCTAAFGRCAQRDHTHSIRLVGAVAIIAHWRNMSWAQLGQMVPRGELNWTERPPRCVPHEPL